MKRIILTFGLVLTGLALFGQSPRIRLNQITKDSLTGSVVLSGSDSNMVYSRDFFLNLTDSVLILFGDTLSTTATAFTGVATDLTLTGNGTVGNELKVDTAIIATVSALADSLAGIISSVTTDLTLTGDGSVATPLKVDTSVIATIKALSDTINARGFLTTEVDGSVTNEGRIGVSAGTATTSVITSNTSGANGVTISAGTGIGLTESTSTNGGTITITNSAPDQTVALTGGTGITTSGTYPNFTITNSAPDQTVSITGAGINSVTGTYPNFTITGTEVDGSTTNELQTISTSGAAGNITLSNGGGTLNLNVNDADASVTNEGSLTVGAGGANSSDIVSNTSGSTNVTIAGGSNVTVTESGSTITIASTAGGSGTVTDITAGTFLSGGTITTSGTIALDTASAGLKTYISDNIGTVDLASEVTGTLPVANGGTGATTLTSGSFLKGNGPSAVSGSSNLTETADTVYVAKFLNVDTNTLYVNSDSNRVAIGQTQTLEGAGLSVRGGLHIIDPDTTNFADNVVYIYPKEQTTSGPNASEFAMYMAGPGSTNSNQGPNFILRGKNFTRFGNQKGAVFFSAATQISSPTGDDGIVKFLTDGGSLTVEYDGDVVMTDNAYIQGTTLVTSDINLKNNINDYYNGLEKILNLRPVSFYLNNDKDNILNFGFIAQDVEEILPELVRKNNNSGSLYLNYDNFIPILVNGIKEQQLIIQSQKQEIETLKTQYNDLLQRIINLENK